MHHRVYSVFQQRSRHQGTVYGAPLGICFIPFTGTQNGYEEFSAPIQWLIPIISPDTIVTAIISSTLFNMPIPGSILTVDNIHFIGASTPYPNGDFENWVEYSAEEPDNWFTSNVFSFSVGETPVTKTDDSYEGNYAIRIENTLTLWDDTLGFITNGTFGEDGPIGGMPIDSIPDLLSGYYKYSPVGPDTAIAGISLFYYSIKYAFLKKFILSLKIFRAIIKRGGFRENNPQATFRLLNNCFAYLAFWVYCCLCRKGSFEEVYR